jgi:poly-gamma-glutamate capsule biosynthesis protein CapA/YwtB (metallophosphatase superfamily)
MSHDGELILSCDRRQFLARTGGAILCGFAAEADADSPAREAEGASSHAVERTDMPGSGVRLFLCGDVMTGRGIDQILRQPGDPRLQERFVKSATEYVAIAEQASGPIPRGVGPEYIWGDVLAELDGSRPDARIANLETAVTTANEAWFGKAVHYRMNPANVACLAAAKIDCCTLANNHILDWGDDGLDETLRVLHAAGIRTAGAGANDREARAPAVIERSTGGRILVFACGSPSSGIPDSWAARSRRPGVSMLDESDPTTLEHVVHDVRNARRRGDIVVVSIHWGGNWGYDVPRQQQRLAHALIDEAGVDVVCGHSSHHPRPIEVHAGKLILYGCGDFLNDYEGIGSQQGYRPELGFMYLPELDPSGGSLRRLALVPTRIRRFRVNRASASDAEWLQGMMNREGRAFGTRVERTPAGELELRWGPDGS